MKSNIFQLAILAVFAFLAIAGVIFFAFFSSGSKSTTGNVTLWGTLDASIMKEQLEFIRDATEDVEQRITYVEKDPRTYNDDLIEALASGTGPDLFLLAQDDIVRQLNKIFVVSYDTYTERKFKDTFIEVTELYLYPEGIVALPYVIDPLVLYWNRDILSREGIATPPEFWDEFFQLSPKITKRDQASNILRATVALGEFRNVTHAKDIISVLMIQAGNPIVVRTEGGDLRNVLTENLGFAIRPAELALRFYTEFSNPIKAVYSWNRALPDSRDAFLADDLAFYFGFASELGDLRRANPNLNFDVAMLPQTRDDGLRATFGRVQALAITNASRNKKGALLAARLLSSEGSLSNLASLNNLPPVSRRLLAKRPTDDIQPIFFDSALIARAWLDPDKKKSEDIFKDMIESITSGKFRVDKALTDAARELKDLLRK
ncbi:extracellular solute-binding protein [Patescibacteria group bacterium]|nr:extracellular solute-binding protein [Patescibacteria group bacterium]